LTCDIRRYITGNRQQNKSVFNYLRALKTHLLLRCTSWCCGASRAAIDRYRLPTWLTAANPPHAAAAGE